MDAGTADYEGVYVFVGVDVGKGEDHAVAIKRSGERLFDRALPNDESRVEQMLGQLEDTQSPSRCSTTRRGPRRSSGDA